jgi:hypothetical protein
MDKMKSTDPADYQDTPRPIARMAKVSLGPPRMAQRAADDFKAIRVRLVELQHTSDSCHHRYVDGRCYACGAADPNGKPF